MKNVLLQNARVVSSRGIVEKDVVFSRGRFGGKVLQVVKAGTVKNFKGEIVNCSRDGLYLMPGLIDVHVHFREPGLTQKGDFTTESRAALRGGITTIFDMPNTKPPTITVAAFKEKLALAKKKCECDFKLFMGAMIDEKGHDNLKEIKKVYNSRRLSKYLAGVKVYMANSTGNLGSLAVLERVLADKDVRDLQVVVHAEDPECILKNISKFDQRNPATWSKARPKECAVSAVREACHLAKRYERKLHIAHVSSLDEALVIEKFRPYVTCEVSPHHLFFNARMYSRYGKFLMVNPPVRSRQDLRGLWQAVYDGLIDVIASDHSPHTLAEKRSGKGVSGMPDVQTVLSMFLNEIAVENFGLRDLARMYCENPARIFGLYDRGFIREGLKADFVLVDAKKKLYVWKEDVMYKCGWSNYVGKSLRGWPVSVIKDGKVVWDEKMV